MLLLEYLDIFLFIIKLKKKILWKKILKSTMDFLV